MDRLKGWKMSRSDKTNRPYYAFTSIKFRTLLTLVGISLVALLYQNCSDTNQPDADLSSNNTYDITRLDSLVDNGDINCTPRQMAPQNLPQGVSVATCIYDSQLGLDLDVYYKTDRSTNNNRDLAFIYIHGGGFSGGTKDRITMDIRNLALEGFVAFSIRYRLSNVAKFPEPVKDVQQALRYIRRHATAFNIDPNKITVGGDSAGGYLASNLGIAPSPDRAGVIDQYSDPVRLVINWYGPSDFMDNSPERGLTDWNLIIDPQCQIFPGCESKSVYERLNATQKAVFKSAYNERYRQHNFSTATLMNRIQTSSSNAAFYILHGTDDTTVPANHSEKLHAALLQHGISSQLNIYQGLGHSFLQLGPNQWETTKAYLLDFYQQNQTPSLIHGQCGSVNNSCIQGTLVDVIDSSTHYKWQCRGVNGGTTDSCQLPKPSTIISPNANVTFTSASTCSVVSNTKYCAPYTLKVRVSGLAQGHVVRILTQAGQLRFCGGNKAEGYELSTGQAENPNLSWIQLGTHTFKAEVADKCDSPINKREAGTFSVTASCSTSHAVVGGVCALQVAKCGVGNGSEYVHAPTSATGSGYHLCRQDGGSPQAPAIQSGGVWRATLQDNKWKWSCKKGSSVVQCSANKKTP